MENIFKKQKYRRRGTDTIVVQLQNNGYDEYKCLIVSGTGKGTTRNFNMCEFEPYNGNVDTRFE